MKASLPMISAAQLVRAIGQERFDQLVADGEIRVTTDERGVRRVVQEDAARFMPRVSEVGRE